MKGADLGGTLLEKDLKDSQGLDMERLADLKPRLAGGLENLLSGGSPKRQLFCVES